MEELLLKPAIAIQVWKLIIENLFLSFRSQREASLHQILWEDFESKTVVKSVHFNISNTDSFHFINKIFD